jgi:maleylpyruvate isomerase
MKLTSYFRSTAAYRVRIALKLKQITHEIVPINLLKREHHEPAFHEHNPDKLIPTLDTGEQVLSQSMAILEYLEEAHPDPAILPKNMMDRALVRGLAQTIASDMHPLNNLRVLTYLKQTIGVDEATKLDWYHHWLEQGFDSIETRLANNSKTGLCCFGNTPGLADICLVPQVYNAVRFEFDLAAYPTIQRINEHCLSLPAFATSRPEEQADAQ